MYSIKKIDGKEYNTAKGVSIATELDITNLQFKKHSYRLNQNNQDL